tara:strand:+ start:8452 stop:9252 length:801 start_codon:yes stop_codon:yes gene_type:complete
METEAVIDTHLFVIGPNNSGSTLLRTLIETGSQCLTLPMEGQHVPGFIGPSSRGTGTRLIWASRPEWVSAFRDPSAYDWSKTRRAWALQARNRADDQKSPSRILVTSSPPFLLIVDQLRAQFPDARFIFLARNPYAAIEGIVRRANQQPLAPGEDIAKIAATHIGKSLHQQAINIDQHADLSVSMTYEDLCENPEAAAAKIEDLAPELGSINFAKRVQVKGQPLGAIVNNNNKQIARLTAKEIKDANAVLSKFGGTLAKFGYQLAS